MDRQRIDKWLWHARVVRTRSAAADLVTSGLVRLNRERVTAPSRPVRADDVITVALDRQVRVMKVVGFAERRGDAEAGRVLYADLTPLPPPRDESPRVAAREAGSGRPTKRDRRAIDRLRDEEE
ncbi:MAG TPA: S4 domain-containing protein [Xanthobacteraceae bacterium]|nr:S4 domain-containing protein [Xanthobacteraceae bacterium]